MDRKHRRVEMISVMTMETTKLPRPLTPDRGQMLLHAISADDSDTSDAISPRPLELALCADSKDILGGTVFSSPG